MKPNLVIPGGVRSTQTRNPEMESECVSGFRVPAFGRPRNDEEPERRA
jgi:hypothetical protein